MKHIILFAASLSLAACAPVRMVGPPVQTDGLVTFGQSTRVGHLVVTPKSVVEDSRCPINARCVWAGRLLLSTLVEGVGRRETVVLTLGQTYQFHGTALALVAAEPDKLAGTPPSPPASLFGFEPR